MPKSQSHPREFFSPKVPTETKSGFTDIVIAFAPPIIWGGVIFWFSAQSALPSLDLSTMDFFAKKIAHITVYAVLYFLLFRAFFRTFRFKNAHMYWFLPLLLCLVYSITDEIHQAFTPGRSPSPRDIGYDMLGAGIALLYQYGYI